MTAPPHARVPVTGPVGERPGFVIAVREEPADSAIYREFAEAVGLDELRAAYGDHWPRGRVAEERVWSFHFGGERVGWTSLICDEPEQVVWMSNGVWPAFRGREIGRWMTRWAQWHAFDPTLDPSRLAAAARPFRPKAICLRVLDTNPGLQRKFEARPGRWQFAGRIEVPRPGSVVFAVTRERYEAARAAARAGNNWERPEGGSTTSPPPAPPAGLAGKPRGYAGQAGAADAAGSQALYIQRSENG